MPSSGFYWWNQYRTTSLSLPVLKDLNVLYAHISPVAHCHWSTTLKLGSYWGKGAQGCLSLVDWEVCPCKYSMGSPGSCFLKLLYLYFRSIFISACKMACTWQCLHLPMAMSSVRRGCQQQCLVLLTTGYHIHVQSCQHKGTSYFRREMKIYSRLTALFWFVHSSQESREACLEFNVGCHKELSWFKPSR